MVSTVRRRDTKGHRDMTRSRYSTHVTRCAHPGCNEVFRTSCSSKKDFDREHAYYQRNPWHCYRHRPGYVTPESPTYTATVEYTNQHVSVFGVMSEQLFWSPDGQTGKGLVNTISCPTFAVESSLFPEGAKLTITVTVKVTR